MQNNRKNFIGTFTAMLASLGGVFKPLEFVTTVNPSRERNPKKNPRSNATTIVDGRFYARDSHGSIIRLFPKLTREERKQRVREIKARDAAKEKS